MNSFSKLPDSKDFLLVSGFAQTPKGTPMHETYKYLGVVLLINKRTGEILRSDFSVVSKLTNEVLQELLQGFNINRPHEELAEYLRQYVNIPSLGAILQALRAAIDRALPHLK